MGTEKTIGYIYGLRGEPRPDQERFKALLSALGDSIETGILNTNVQDLRVAYIAPPAS